MALDDSDESTRSRSNVIHSAGTSNHRRSVSAPSIEHNSDTSLSSSSPSDHEIIPSPLSSPPPPIGNLQIRQNGRIDWSDISNNAIGCYNQRFEAAYVANSRFADLHFHILTEQLDIPAHSMIISVASAQLEQLCFGDSAGGCAPNTRINVPDCTSAEFLVVLRYLYGSGSIHNLTRTNIVPVTKIAKLFELNHLSDQCSQMLAKMLNTRNVCRLYADLWPLCNAFTQQCLDLMVAHLEEILSNDTAMCMPDDVLFKLFASMEGHPRPNPEHVLHALKRRADRELVAADQPITGAARRQRIGDQRVRLVAFEHMTYLQFANSLRDIGPDFMTDAEIGGWFKRIVMRNPIKLSEQDTLIGCSCGRGGAAGQVGQRGVDFADGLCCLDAGKLQFAALPLPAGRKQASKA